MGENRIGENIKFFRRQKALTQKQLGELAGMQDSAIRRYESGKATPKEENLTKIANALGVSTFQLRMRGVEKSEQWKNAVSFTSYLESIGYDVFYETHDPEDTTEPIVYIQGQDIGIDITNSEYEGIKKNVAAYAKHLIDRYNQKKGD